MIKLLNEKKINMEAKLNISNIIMKDENVKIIKRDNNDKSGKKE